MFFSLCLLASADRMDLSADIDAVAAESGITSLECFVVAAQGAASAAQAVVSFAHAVTETKDRNPSSLVLGADVERKMKWYEQYEATHSEFKKIAKLTLGEVQKIAQLVRFDFGFDKFEGRWKYSNAVRSVLAGLSTWWLMAWFRRFMLFFIMLQRRQTLEALRQTWHWSKGDTVISLRCSLH
jgi:hypothetical protein